MRFVSALGLAALVLATPGTRADELKSGPDKKTGGSFTVKAITGGQKGKSLCYV